METTAAPSQHGVTDFQILVDGNDVTRNLQVVSIAVNDEVNTVATAKLLMRDGEPAAEKFAVSEQETFAPGKKLTLKLGDNQQKKTVFQGIVVKQCIRAKGENASYLLVECKHAALKMTLGRKNKYFENKKDSEVLENVLSPHGLKGSVDGTSVQHKELVQFNCTDWDFLVSRAEANGCLVFSEGEKLQVKKPVIGSPVATLKYGRNILELEAEMDARTQWKSVKSTAWNFADQALAESESSSSSLTEQGNLTGGKLSEVGGLAAFELRHGGKVEPEELKAWADAAMLKSRLAKIRGRVKVDGNADLKPGVTIQLEGCGARFNGKAYLTGVRHEVASGSWFSHLQFGLAPEWFFQKPDIGLPPAGGLTPPVHGLQIGVVVKLESDPDGEHRIQVKLPTLDNAAKGIWSRVCTLDAGNDRGSFFLPEIGDEVIVGFLNDDPRDAVVLGMLNSSAKPAPVQAKDDNHVKGWQTRSKMKLMFDDENKVVTIETPAKNQVVISEKDKGILLKDQNGNSIELNDQGITIKSVKDIKIEAAQNMNVKAGKDLKQEGSMNAELKAGMQLTAKGGAQAEFSSGGATQLKGAMVKIN